MRAPPCAVTLAHPCRASHVQIPSDSEGRKPLSSCTLARQRCSPSTLALADPWRGQSTAVQLHARLSRPSTVHAHPCRSSVRAVSCCLPYESARLRSTCTAVFAGAGDGCRAVTCADQIGTAALALVPSCHQSRLPTYHSEPRLHSRRAKVPPSRPEQSPSSRTALTLAIDALQTRYDLSNLFY